MKKVLFFLALVCVSQSLFCQQQPKVRYSTGFFNTRYEIGDKDANEKTVLAHFEKTSPQSHYLFKRGMALDVQGTVSGVIGTTGLLIGLFSKKTAPQAAGYAIGAIGYSYSLIVTLGSQSKKEKAIDTYNQAFGY